MLSEYIVKNRGIIPTSAKDALLNYKQVQLHAASRCMLANSVNWMISFVLCNITCAYHRPTVPPFIFPQLSKR